MDILSECLPVESAQIRCEITKKIAILEYIGIKKDDFTRSVIIGREFFTIFAKIFVINENYSTRIGFAYRRFN